VADSASLVDDNSDDH